MNIQQLCDYLNETGIIDMNNIKQFLKISTYIYNDSNKSINDIYKISLFTYIKGILNDDKKLYYTCSNIIKAYRRFIILKKYNSLSIFKKILCIKIYQRYKNFIVSLYKKNLYEIRHNIANNRKKNLKKKLSNENIIKSIDNININVNKKYNTNNNFNSINYEIHSSPNDANTISNINNIEFKNYKFLKNLESVKKSKKIDINKCMEQINLNFDKFFINKKLILCKKSNSSITSLRKNKSEKKLRMMKLNYEDKIRLNNFETLNTKIKRKIRKRKKSKKEELLKKKKEENKIYDNLKQKEIDKNNWVDRLYRESLIKKMDEERKQKKNLIIKEKQTINWEDIYLNTNNKIIKNNKEKELLLKNSMNKSCSYFKPKRGRIYKQEIITEEKVNDNIEDKDLKDKDKSIKISLELNTENNNNKIININSDNNVFEIKESELNSINSEKEKNKSIDSKDINENEELKDNNEKEINKNNNNFNNFKSKGLQNLLFNNKKTIPDLKKNNINNINNELSENEENNKKKQEKNKFNYLLCSNNNDDNNII